MNQPPKPLARPPLPAGRARMGPVGRWLGAVVMLAAASACGSADDAESTDRETAAPAAGASADGVLGTIRATVDGERRTWYVVQADSRGEPYSSGMFIPGDDVRVVSLGGFDTPDLPFDDFRTDPVSGNPTLGGYDGSALQIAVNVPVDQSSVTYELSDETSHATIAFMPTASMEDVMEHTLFAISGAIEVESAEFGAETASISGTFSGDLAVSGGADTVRFSDGRFEVKGLPAF